jgi:hypothetical protein
MAEGGCAHPISATFGSSDSGQVDVADASKESIAAMRYIRKKA